MSRVEKSILFETKHGDIVGFTVGNVRIGMVCSQHGKEAAFIQDAVNAVAEEFADKVPGLAYIPVINPMGVWQGTRENEHGDDTNRSWRFGTEVAESKVAMKFLWDLGQLDAFIDFHGDETTNGLHVYVLKGQIPRLCIEQYQTETHEIGDHYNEPDDMSDPHLGFVAKDAVIELTKEDLSLACGSAQDFMGIYKRARINITVELPIDQSPYGRYLQARSIFKNLVLAPLYIQ